MTTTKPKKTGPRNDSVKYTPSREEWTAMASQAGREWLVVASGILSGSQQPRMAKARAWAWKLILDQNPHYSIAGVARVSGFDHTTILTALRRLDGASNTEILISRATGRRPILRKLSTGVEQTEISLPD